MTRYRIVGHDPGGCPWWLSRDGEIVNAAWEAGTYSTRELAEYAIVLRSSRLPQDGWTWSAEEAPQDRNTTPLGDRRERAVPCSICRRGTLAISAVCHYCEHIDLPGLATG